MTFWGQIVKSKWHLKWSFPLKIWTFLSGIETAINIQTIYHLDNSGYPQFDHSKTGPFWNRPTLNYWKTEHVQFLDPHYIFNHLNTKLVIRSHPHCICCLKYACHCFLFRRSVRAERVETSTRRGRTPASRRDCEAQSSPATTTIHRQTGFRGKVRNDEHQIWK